MCRNGIKLKSLCLPVSCMKLLSQAGTLELHSSTYILYVYLAPLLHRYWPFHPILCTPSYIMLCFHPRLITNVRNVVSILTFTYRVGHLTLRRDMNITLGLIFLLTAPVSAFDTVFLFFPLILLSPSDSIPSQGLWAQTNISSLANTACWSGCGRVTHHNTGRSQRRGNLR